MLLILGGTDFIGKTLLDQLHPLPYRICCINRGKTHWNDEARRKYPSIEWQVSDRKDHRDY